MKTPISSSSEIMPTLSQCINKSIQEGYSENFKVTDKGLTTDKQDKFYSPEQVRISNFYRFEGQSDPQDNAILYCLETDDGMRGTLVDAYGVYADEMLSLFITEVEEIHKKLNSNLK